MKRTFAGFALAAALASTVWLGTEVGAQTKTKKDPPPATATPPSVAGKVEIVKGEKGFRWRIVDGDGKTVAMPVASKHFATKKDALEALDEVKTILKSTPIDVDDTKK